MMFQNFRSYVRKPWWYPVPKLLTEWHCCYYRRLHGRYWCKTHNAISSENCLAKHKHAKKNKYLQAYLTQWMNFVPLIFIVNGMMDQETKVFAKRLGKHLIIKWGQLFSQLINCLLTHLSIMCIYATHCTHYLNHIS